LRLQFSKGRGKLRFFETSNYRLLIAGTSAEEERKKKRKGGRKGKTPSELSGGQKKSVGCFSLSILIPAILKRGGKRGNRHADSRKKEEGGARGMCHALLAFRTAKKRKGGGRERGKGAGIGTPRSRPEGRLEVI